jgi:hypothetical protein
MNEVRGPLDLLGERASDRVGHVDLAALERGQPRRLVRDHLEDEPLHGRDLSPVLVEGLERQLHTGVEGDELVGPGAHRRLLEAVLAHALDVLLRHDPARAGRRSGVEGEEVRPGALEDEAHAPGVDDLHLAHAVVEQLVAGAPVALEGELDVLRGHGIAVVKARALAQHEFVRGAVGRRRPRLRERRRHGLPRHRLHQRVVKGVEDHEGRDQPGRLRGVEPRGGERDVHAPGDLALGRRVGGREGEQEGTERDDRKGRGSHHDVSSSDWAAP